MSKRPSLAETMRLATSDPEGDPASQRLHPPPHTAAPAGRDNGFFAATRVGKEKVTATLAPADHKPWWAGPGARRDASVVASRSRAS